jgi:type IV pilus assembly protein PilQ
MDNIEAVISQGEQIPYVSLDDAGNTKVEFKDADLSLVVTPRITVEGKISMNIKAENNYADWAKAAELELPGPPLITSKVGSTVVVNDGDTIVIGGIYKSSETKGGSAIPWLSEIPVLGWLFKDRSVRKEQRELLIFITPVILGETTIRG